jgi:hypothetical protein
METTNDFSKALNLERMRKKANWWWGYYYYESGLYYKQCKRYFDIFPEKNILIFKFNQLINNRNYVLKRIFQFLDINDNFNIEESLKENSTYFPKHLILQKIKRIFLYKYLKYIIPGKIRKIIKNYNITKKKIDRHEKIKLKKKYRQEMLNLEKLIELNLKDWIE